MYEYSKVGFDFYKNFTVSRMDVSGKNATDFSSTLLFPLRKILSNVTLYSVYDVK